VGESLEDLRNCTRDQLPEVHREDGAPIDSRLSGYVVEVYLMRAAARRNECSGFTIDIAIPAEPSARQDCSASIVAMSPCWYRY
jgi:hypothetical protein